VRERDGGRERSRGERGGRNVPQAAGRHRDACVSLYRMAVCGSMSCSMRAMHNCNGPPRGWFSAYLAPLCHHEPPAHSRGAAPTQSTLVLHALGWARRQRRMRRHVRAGRSTPAVQGRTSAP
jgi:hypothetical protein